MKTLIAKVLALMPANLMLAFGLISCFISGLAIASVSQAAVHSHSHASTDRPSVHGMMMMGKETVYLSHLPMFHSPHDYQALLEVEIDEPGKKAYVKSQLSSDETVYTLVPESFVLPEMVANPRPFKAQVFKGHFERGGKLIAQNVTVTIKSVLHFRKLDADAEKPLASTQLLFGNEKEQFLAHMIHGQPDFDQILSVKVPAEIATNLTHAPSLVVTAQGHPNSEPLNNSDFLEAVSSNGSSQKVPIEVLKSLYLEFGDLAL